MEHFTLELKLFVEEQAIKGLALEYTAIEFILATPKEICFIPT